MIGVSNVVSIQPGVEFTYITGSLKFGEFIQPIQNTTVITLGMPLIIQNSPSVIVVVAPFLGIGDDITTVGATFSLTRPWLSQSAR